MSDIESTAPADVIPAAPVVATTPEPVQPANQESETPAEGEQKQAAKPEGPTDEERAFQKRLGIESRRMKRQLEAEVRAEYAERQLAELKAPPKPVQTSGEPVPAQFQDYESYIAALTDWKVDQKLGGIRKESEAQQAQRELRQIGEKILPKFESAREKYDDFDDVVKEFVGNTPQPVHDAVLESSVPEELLYYLGQNPTERERIFRLSNVGQVKAISALESKLTATPSPTKTPAPIVPNNGKSSVSKSPSDMSYDEFAEYRRKRLAKRR